MALTAKDLIDEMDHALAGLPERAPMRLVNEAGRHLCNMHSWRFLKRPKVYLASVAGQAYVELPADFGTMLGIEIEGGFSQTWTQLDEGAFLALESGAWDESGWAYWAIVENAVTTDGTAPVPRLGVWPAPTATSSTFAAMRYLAKWQDVYAEDDVLQVPDFAETLLIQLAREFARGYDEDHKGTLDQRLAMIQAGPVYMAARSQDANTQWRYGKLRNGAAGAIARYRYWDVNYTPPS